MTRDEFGEKVANSLIEFYGNVVKGFNMAIGFYLCWKLLGVVFK